MSFRSFIFTLFLALATAIIFSVWPELDIRVSRLFYVDGSFFGSNVTGRAVRKFFLLLPGAIFIVMAAAWLLQRFGLIGARKWIPGTRSIIFISLALALAPGLLVNVVLKEHWGRPRPVQVLEFNGNSAFRPWWRTDGACQKNCSFVSGEASSGFWLMAPASLAPVQVRAVVMVAAFATGFATAAGRVVFGKHFLSDVIFAALFTLLICQLLHLLIIKNGRRRLDD